MLCTLKAMESVLSKEHKDGQMQVDNCGEIQNSKILS